MADALVTTEELPLVDAAREDFYSLIETSTPGAGMVDGVNLVIESDKVALAIGVPRWEKVTFDYTDVVALGGSSGALTILTLPDGGIVHAVKIMQTVQWGGGSVSALDGKVGITGTAGKYVAAHNLLTAPGTGVATTSFTTGAEEQTKDGTGSGTALKLTVTATTDTLDHLTAGELLVWVLWSATEV